MSWLSSLFGGEEDPQLSGNNYQALSNAMMPQFNASSQPPAQQINAYSAAVTPQFQNQNMGNGQASSDEHPFMSALGKGLMQRMSDGPTSGGGQQMQNMPAPNYANMVQKRGRSEPMDMGTMMGMLQGGMSGYRDVSAEKARPGFLGGILKAYLSGGG